MLCLGDVSPVRCGAIPQVMAAMRTAMSDCDFQGIAIAKATHFFASKPKLLTS